MLTAGADGAAKALMKAKGPNLILPPLPLALPVRVQLQSTNATCWETTFSSTGTTVDDTTRFTARSD